jgi:hypothetical protein
VSFLQQIRCIMLLTDVVRCRRSFERLLQRFAVFYSISQYRPKGGRPRKLQHHHHVLGLLLAFYVGSMQHKSLCSIFGVPHSTLSRVLTEGEEALKASFVGFSPARIVCPSSPTKGLWLD